jgi:WD40 repeat protein
MNSIRRRIAIMTPVLYALLLMLFAGSGMYAHAADEDVLAITDFGDSKLKLFNAQTGELLQPPTVKIGDQGLHGPTGVIFDPLRKEWIVSNQNVNLPYNGEILRYDSQGKLVGTLVAKDDPNGPLGPQGIILSTNRNGERILFIADQGDFIAKGSIDVPGKLLAYRITGTTATFMADLNPNIQTPGATGPQFHPRGLVIGPDGYLYVSIRNLPGPCGGSILRFDPERLAFVNIFLSNPADCSANVNDLHRPEGLVFSPRGDLYVTSFRAGQSDVDRILIVPKGSFNGDQIRLPLDRIDLYTAGEPRVFAQALLFGPDGNLFVPISNTGEVRRYNVTTKGFWTFVAAGKALSQPWFLSFQKTNPATLAYRP